MKTNNKYWFRSEWDGKKREFLTFAQAKRAAKSEYGQKVAIYDSNNNITFVEASGFTPA